MNSMASSEFMSASIFRSIHIRLATSFDRSRSSLLVPDDIRSMAGENAAVGYLAVELKFHVARAFEFFEYHFVHFEPVSIRAVAIIVSDPPFSMFLAARKESFLGFVQRIGVDTSGRTLPEAGGYRVVGSGQTGYAVQSITTSCPLSTRRFCFFNDDVGYSYVSFGRFVECKGYHFGFDPALHVGDFFRAFVDEQHYLVHLRVVGYDCVGYILKQYGLTCFWLSYYHGPSGLFLLGRRGLLSVSRCLNFFRRVGIFHWRKVE